VELHHAMFKKQQNLDPNRVSLALQEFYTRVDTPEMRADPEGAAGKYYKSALQATNDRSSRILRGEILLAVIQNHG
jgi:hypothetical protein